jgi:hypothetical protein
MEDKIRNHKAEHSAQQWKNLWNALSEETTAENDISYPQAEQVKHELLQGLAHDARAHVTPSKISSVLEQTGRARASEPDPLHWPEAKEPEPFSGNKAQSREVKPERDTDIDR